VIGSLLTDSLAATSADLAIVSASVLVVMVVVVARGLSLSTVGMAWDKLKGQRTSDRSYRWSVAVCHPLFPGHAAGAGNHVKAQASDYKSRLRAESPMTRRCVC
jgi:hypothetical protein